MSTNKKEMLYISRYIIHTQSSQIVVWKGEPEKECSLLSEKAPAERHSIGILEKRRPSSDATIEKGKKHHCSSTPSKSLLGKDDPGKPVVQETTVDKNDRRKKFSISLSRKEIEEDIIILTGRKPDRKPKKRPKALQNEHSTLYSSAFAVESHIDM
ncbi:uncharacterized protein LOC114578443 [Dendrobium catenatum]|uniref:uncharacterized protein LOC114578443 n=1 Tax=Dendrobium catenatum TaxID=906689 RepID=UPI0010A0B4EA|nr:uncharacterized protein LOC114578443 [Dendrobium catenatum]